MKTRPPWTKNICIPIGYYRKPISYLPELFKVFEVFWAAIIFKFILFLSLSFPSLLSDIQLCGIIHGFPQAYSIYMITLLSISSSNAMWVHIVQSMMSVDTCLSVVSSPAVFSRSVLLSYRTAKDIVRILTLWWPKSFCFLETAFDH